MTTTDLPSPGELPEIAVDPAAFRHLAAAQVNVELDTGDTSAAGGDTALDAPLAADIIVLQASAEELAEHDASLVRLDKESKGACIWRSLVPVPD